MRTGIAVGASIPIRTWASLTSVIVMVISSPILMDSPVLSITDHDNTAQGN